MEGEGRVADGFILPAGGGEARRRVLFSSALFIRSFQAAPELFITDFLAEKDLPVSKCGKESRAHGIGLGTTL